MCMSVVKSRTARFAPETYDVGTMEEAQAVILHPRPGGTVDERWTCETPYLGGLIEKHLGLTKDTLLLDFGCGVGRLSWETMRRTGCKAVGVDYSASMRALAASYVDSPRFMACAVEMLDVLGPFQFDAAITVWVLQHCLNPIIEIRQITRALKPGGLLFVLNDKRCIPTNHGFVSDDADVKAMLFANLKLKEVIQLDPLMGERLLQTDYCAIYQKAY